VLGPDASAASTAGIGSGEGYGEPPRSRRRGRPAGAPGSREVVLQAARVAFAERSFEQVTVRDIGKRAGVDAAMVNHWFGGKHGLFTAAAELSVNAEDVAHQLVSGPRGQVGERLLRTFLAVGEEHPLQMAILIRNMHSSEFAERELRGLLENVMVRPVINAFAVDEPRVRIALCGSQLIGLAVARFAAGVSALAQLSSDDLVAVIGPTIQRYLEDAVRSSGSRQ
jgi:AcrR family transcriptional regulator